MEKTTQPPSLEMTQRIYDRAHKALDDLRLSLRGAKSALLDDAVLADIYRKNDLFITAYKNLCREKNEAKIMYDLKDPQFFSLRNWAQDTCKGFIPKEPYGILKKDSPQTSSLQESDEISNAGATHNHDKVSVLPPPIPYEVGGSFELLVMNIVIFKGRLDKEIENKICNDAFFRRGFEQVERLKDELGQAYDKIDKHPDKESWRDLYKANDDFISSLKTLAAAKKKLNITKELHLQTQNAHSFDTKPAPLMLCENDTGDDVEEAFTTQDLLDQKQRELRDKLNTSLNQTSLVMAKIKNALNSRQIPPETLVEEMSHLEDELKTIQHTMRGLNFLDEKTRNILNLAQAEMVNIYRQLPKKPLPDAPVEKALSLKNDFNKQLEKTSAFIGLFNNPANKGSLFSLPADTGPKLAQSLKDLDTAMESLSAAYNNQTPFIKDEIALYNYAKMTLNVFAQKYGLDITPS